VGANDNSPETPGGEMPPESNNGAAPETPAGSGEFAPPQGAEAGVEPVKESAAPEPTPEPAKEPAAPGPIPEWTEPPRKRHHVAPALIALERVLDDKTFQVRPEGELSLLATDIARLGQLFPVDLRLVPPDKFQIISGFRRVAALRFLQRDKVLARLHTDISDEDALLTSLAAAIHGAPVTRENLSAVRARLEREGRLTPAARDMLEKALATEDHLAPEGPEEEVDADELALDVTARLGEINQDLALLADVFGSLDEERKRELVEQLRYSADLVAFLEGR
jgi:ParB family chromosome partitioning protein